MPIYDQSAKSGPIRQSVPKMQIQYQYLTNLPIQCQSFTNLPIHPQSTNTGLICQYFTNLSTFDIYLNPSPIGQRLSILVKSSVNTRPAKHRIHHPPNNPSTNQWKLDCHQLAVHWHALAHMMLIRCQSEDNCPTNLGTSILYGSTDSLNGGWFRTFHNATARPIQPTPCHNANPWSFHCQSTVNPCLIPLILKGTSSK